VFIEGRTRDNLYQPPPHLFAILLGCTRSKAPTRTSFSGAHREVSKVYSSYLPFTMGTQCLFPTLWRTDVISIYFSDVGQLIAISDHIFNMRVHTIPSASASCDDTSQLLPLHYQRMPSPIHLTTDTSSHFHHHLLLLFRFDIQWKPYQKPCHPEVMRLYKGDDQIHIVAPRSSTLFSSSINLFSDATSLTRSKKAQARSIMSHRRERTMARSPNHK